MIKHRRFNKLLNKAFDGNNRALANLCLLFHSNSYALSLEEIEEMRKKVKSGFEETESLKLSRLTLESASASEESEMPLLPGAFPTTDEKELPRKAQQLRGICYLFQGFMYYYGFEGDTDYDKANECFDKGIRLGNSMSMYYRGHAYEHGLGKTGQNLEIAHRLFERARKLGDSIATYHLAYMYENGIGVKADILQAIAILEEAIKLKFTPAMHHSANIHAKGFGDDLKPDYPKAIELYKQAVKFKYKPSMESLANIYAKGMGGTQVDLKRAIRLYRKALPSKGAIEQLENLKIEHPDLELIINYHLAIAANRSDEDELLKRIIEEDLFAVVDLIFADGFLSDQQEKYYLEKCIPTLNNVIINFAHNRTPLKLKKHFSIYAPMFLTAFLIVHEQKETKETKETTKEMKEAPSSSTVSGRSSAAFFQSKPTMKFNLLLGLQDCYYNWADAWLAGEVNKTKQGEIEEQLAKEAGLKSFLKECVSGKMCDRASKEIVDAVRSYCPEWADEIGVKIDGDPVVPNPQACCMIL